ncbi:uncharacterized protein LOC108151243 [Drosophila miranda]|uniref:Uncharacterized protein ghi n=2 Tax=obscura group TaxID=32355 RepID=Q29EF3_DROPS|nr:uncharacterized protein LOC4812159 [Drosophila pseudoobscura]XP_017135233.1 uncharacterized protein LOC108151243 [Drosophila miranda]XP_026847343.1 uncharacterized protein LOC113566332 [Drosophila persimilis]
MILDNVVEFASYWWFRYLMVTELYMVEKWERVTIHVLFMVLFCVFWYFNYSVLLSLAGLISPNTLIADILPGAHQGQGVKVI